MAAEYRTALPTLTFLLKVTADLKRLANDLHIHRHSGGKESRNTVGKKSLRDRAYRALLAVAHVTAKIAVNMQIDKSGRNVAAVRVDDLNVSGKLIRGKDALDNVAKHQSEAVYDTILQDYFSIYNSFHHNTSL